MQLLLMQHRNPVTFLHYLKNDLCATSRSFAPQWKSNFVAFDAALVLPSAKRPVVKSLRGSELRERRNPKTKTTKLRRVAQRFCTGVLKYV